MGDSASGGSASGGSSQCEWFWWGFCGVGFVLLPSRAVIFEAPVVIIAAGGGEFVPKKPPLAELSRFEESSVRYAVKRREEFRDKDLIIAGGGDSAVDWAVDLSSLARSVVLVHRRPEYRAAPGMVARLRELAAEGRVRVGYGSGYGFVWLVGGG